jgi:hypothetical protein
VQPGISTTLSSSAPAGNTISAASSALPFGALPPIVASGEAEADTGAEMEVAIFWDEAAGLAVVLVDTEGVEGAKSENVPKVSWPYKME